MISVFWRRVLLAAEGCYFVPTHPLLLWMREKKKWGGHADAGGYNQHIIQGMRGYNYRNGAWLSLTAPVGKTGSHFGQVGHLSLEMQVKVTAL